MGDLKFALRQLFKNPGFTAVAVLTLALGIGANTAIFSVINGLLLKPLPYPDSERLVSVWERNPSRGIEQERVSGPDYLDWHAQNTVFSDMAACPGWEGSEKFNLLIGDTTVKVHATYTASSLFSTLGTKPLLGRVLGPDEDRVQGNQAAVIGFPIWQQYFGGNSNVVGQKLTLDTYGRRDYTIVGVMPASFGVPSECQIWLPFGWMGVTFNERRSAHWHNVVARLKPNVTLERARLEMNAIQARLKNAYPGETIGSEVAVVPLLQQAVGRNLRTALLALWGVVAGVLLIGCANVANLTLARAASRQKEMAVRRALGAARFRLVRQLLMETVVLSGIAGSFGVFIAWWGLRFFVLVCPAGIPRLDQLTIDPVALSFTAELSLLTGLLFGLTPALQFTRVDLNEGLRQGARGNSSHISMVRSRNLLIVTELAMSLVLLSAAGLMLQSFAKMLRAERGFKPEHLLTAQLDFSVSGFSTWVRPTQTRPQVPLHALMEQLRTLPGVEYVGAGSRMIRAYNGPPQQTMSIFGRPELTSDQRQTAEFIGISPGWIQALGARLLDGRDFTENDRLEAPGAMIINQTFARRFFPNENPIGSRMRLGAEQPPLDATNVWGLSEWRVIVGVVSDIKSLDSRPEAVPEVYAPYWQWPMQTPTLFIRAAGDPTLLSQELRRETKQLIPNLPGPVVRTMDNLVSATLAQARLQSGLIFLFAITALLLAAVGLYGVLAYIVNERRQEIGIRMALGARKADVLRLVIGQGMKLVASGMVVGLIGALGLTRLIRSLLYGVTPTDPLTFTVVIFVLAGSALLACWLPARRAASLNPTEALRYE